MSGTVLPICEECGNDEVCEGFDECSECLEKCVECKGDGPTDVFGQCHDCADDLVPHDDLGGGQNLDPAGVAAAELEDEGLQVLV